MIKSVKIGATLTIDSSADVAAPFQEDARLLVLFETALLLAQYPPRGVTGLAEKSCMITDIMLNAASVYPMFAAVKTNNNFASFTCRCFSLTPLGLFMHKRRLEIVVLFTSEFKSIINQQLRL